MVGGTEMGGVEEEASTAAFLRVRLSSGGYRFHWANPTTQYPICQK
jgi:hypothetical protein